MIREWITKRITSEDDGILHKLYYLLGKKVLLQFNVYSQQLNLMAYEYLYLDLYEILPKGIH